MQNKHINTIDCYRIFFIIVIIISHVGVFYNPKLLDHFRNGYMTADFFFIIAGYFLVSIFESKLSLKDFVIKKAVRLLPVYYVTNFLLYFFHPNWWNFKAIFATATLTAETGIINLHCLNGFAWFTVIYFWISIFYFCLFRKIKTHKCMILTSFLIIFSYLILYSVPNGDTIHFENIHRFFNGGVLRAIAGFGIGILINYSNKFIKLPSTKWSFTLFSFLEFIILWFIFKNTTLTNAIRYSIILTVPFCFLLYSTVNQLGIFSRVLNKKAFSFLGKYTYSIYLFQGIPLILFSQYKAFMALSHLIQLNLIFWCSILGGILLYHFIEAPCINLYKNFYLKRKDN